MAGMGPPPNPNARRQNKRNDGFTELVAPNSAEVPALPGDDWSEATVAAWLVWWKSPQSTQWDEADLPTLYLVAQMYDAAVQGNMDAAKEFRQWADRFGFSSLARLRNRWVIKPGTEAEAAAEAVERTVGSVVPLRRKSG